MEGEATDLLLWLVVREDAPPRRDVQVLCDNLGTDHMDGSRGMFVLLDDLDVSGSAGREEDWVQESRYEAVLPPRRGSA